MTHGFETCAGVSMGRLHGRESFAMPCTLYGNAGERSSCCTTEYFLFQYERGYKTQSSETY